MAPQVPLTPRSPAHRERVNTVDTSDSSARDAHERRDEGPQEASEELRRSCFYCLEGWVFLGSIGPDGEEVYEAFRCRRCGGTGRL